MFNAGQSQYGSLSGNEDRGVHAVHEVTHHIGTDLPADMDDEAGDQKTCHAVGPPDSGGYPNQTEEGTGRRDRIEPGVLGVNDEGGGLDPGADPPLVASNELVPDNAHDGSSHAETQVRGCSMMNKLVNADVPRKNSAAPDDDGDTQTGHVFGPFETVGV